MDDTHPRTGLADDVRPLVFPRSLALVGASPRTAAVVAGTVGRGVPVQAVNPNRADALGLRCRPAVAALPERPELAVLLVGHRRVEDAFEEAVAAGVRAFLLPGLGNEAGAEAPAVTARIAARAAEVGAAVLGPNCMGVAVPGGVSPWIGTVPDSFAPGRVAVVTQSGSIGEALVTLGGRVGFRCVVSSGGEAVRDAADLVAFLAADEDTGAIGLFLEAVRRPAALAEALVRCAEAAKPVVCLKVGRSRAGARAALAHTGALVGSERAFSALLRRHGAIEVDDFTDLVETLEVLGRGRRPRGRRVAALSESGGEGALLADRAEAAGIPFDPLPSELATALRAEFPNYAAAGNPLDAWAVDEPDRVFPRSLELIARSGAFDVLVAQVDHSQFRGEAEHEWCFMVLRALADAVAGTDVFPAAATVAAVDPRPEVTAFARERDVALLRGTGAAARALAAAAGWRPAAPRAPADAEPIDLSDLLRPGALPELESTLVLERYGVPFPPRRRAGSPAEAARAAAELGWPVAVKADGPAHKDAAGGVVLGVASEEAARAAAERLGGRVLVAREVPAGAEIFCGLARDRDYGAVLAVGLGGRAVEKLARPAVVLAPVALEEALALVDGAPGLAAVTPAPARRTVAEVLAALGRLAGDHPEIVEVDVNPLVVGPGGAVAVDALVVVEQGGPR